MGNFGTAVFTAVLNNSQLLTAARTSQGALAGLSRSATTAGAGLTAGLSVPLIATAGIAVKRSTEIETAWNEVRATYNLTDFSKVEKAVRPHGELADKVDYLSTTYGLNRTAVIENLGTLSQMGYVGKRATGQLQQGLEFAVAAGIPLEEGLSTSVSLTNTFGLEGQKLTDALRGLNKVENDTAASGQDLTDGLRRAGGSATALIGPGFDAGDAIGSIAGGMAVFKGAGQETMRSADAMRAIFQRLYTTGPKVNKLFDKMGVSVKNADGSLKPFPELLGDIGGNFDKLNSQEQLQFTKSAIGVEFGPLFKLLIDDVNKGNKSLFTTAKKGFEDTKAGEDAYKRELKIRGESMAAVIGRIGAGFDKLLDAAQPVIKQLITPLANGLGVIAQKFSESSPSIQKFVIILGALIAVLGPLLILMGVMSAAIGAISLPVVLVVAGIAALVVGIMKLVQWLNAGSKPALKVKAALEAVWKIVKSQLISAWEQLSKGIQSLMPVLKLLGAIIGVALVAAVLTFSTALRIIAVVFHVVAAIVGWFVNLLWSLFKWLFNVLVGHSIIPDMVNAIVDWFKKGAAWMKAIWDAVINTIKWVWNTIKAVVVAVAQWIVKAIQTYLNALKAFWTAIWNAIKAVVTAVWNGIKNAVVAAWNWLVSYLKRSLDGWKRIWTAVWNTIKTVVTTIWNGIKTAVKAAWDWVVNILRTGLNNMKTNWSRAWDTIKSVVSTVWGKIKSVFDTFKTGLGQLATKFSAVKDAIGRAWNQVKEIAAKPIRFVLDTVINKGLIKGFNWISGKVGGPHIDPVKIGFASGGFTGRGGKYTPAGTVHRGEVVWSQEDIRRAGGVGPVEAARKGRYSALLGDYADGGVVGTLKGLWNKATSAVSTGWNWLKDMGKNLLPDLSGLGDSYFGKLAKGAATKLKDLAISKLKGVFGSGGGPSMGKAGMGWRAMWAIVHRLLPNIQLTSSVRSGRAAITALGNRSLHGMGRAIDVAPPSMAAFHTIKRAFPNATQLFYSPADGQTLLRGKPWRMDPVTKAGHWDHIHLGMRSGGLVPGSGRGDRTPLKGEAGEFMLRRTVVRRIGLATLARANNSNDPLGVFAAAAGSRLNSRTFVPGEFGRSVARTAVRPIETGGLAAKVAVDHSGDSIGTQSFTWNVYNPVAERASESTQERLRRSAALGLIGSRTSKGGT